MNIGYIISSTIAGVIFLSLISLNMKVVRNSGEQTLDAMANAHSLSVSEYLEHDLRSIGYGVQGTNPILQVTDHSIRFLIKLDGETDATEVVWQYELDAVSEHGNDAVKPLYRYHDGMAWHVSAAVTAFELEYYDHMRQQLDPQTLNPADIRQIRWTIITQTHERYFGGRYGTSVWTGEVTPHNLVVLP